LGEAQQHHVDAECNCVSPFPSSTSRGALR